MLNKQSNVCMILKSKEEIDFFATVLKAFGVKNITGFDNPEEAYEAIIRKPFDLFFTRMELAPMSGLTLIQKIRQTQNYGHETQFFVADKIDNFILNTLNDLNITYVLVKPFTPDRIESKLKYILKNENNLPLEEKLLREAHSALHNKLIDMAETIAKKLYTEKPQYEKALSLLGQIEETKGNTKEAREFFNKAIEANKGYYEAYNRLAQSYVKSKEFDKAVEILEQIADKNPHNISMLENTGLSHFEVGNTEKATQYMKKVHEMDSKNKTSSEILANIAVQNGDYDSMVKFLEKTHDQKDLVSYLNNTGVALSKQHSYEEAIKMYEKCSSHLETSEHNYVVFYNMGLAYKKMEEPVLARQYFQKALKVKPDFVKASHALASLSIPETHHPSVNKKH